MYRKLSVVTIIVLLLSLAFASVSFAQTGTGSQSDQGNQTNDQSQQDQANNQGMDPGSAFTSAGQGRSLGASQRHWYAFRYAGDNSQIQVRLRNATNIMFSVWSQQDIQNAAGNFGATANPVGRSTTNSSLGGDPYWTGSFNAPGTYFVMVEPMSGSNGGNYSLEVTGSGVSWQGGNQGQGDNQSGNNNQSNNNASGQTGTSGNTQGQTGANTSAQAGAAPSTLPVTGGEMASVVPLLLGGIGALGVAAGALLRRKK